jgi:AraC-like DNA-binding protein
MKEQEFRFAFQLHDLFEYSQQLAQKLGVEMENDTLVYPADIAQGGSRFFKINEFISFQLVHFKALQRMVFDRLPNSSNHITISIQDFTFAQCPVHKFNCNEILIDNSSLGSVQCKSTKINEIVVVEPGTEVKVIFVLLKENWIENVLRDTAAKEKFYAYLVNRHANIRKEFLTPDQLKLVHEIFNLTKDSPLQKMYYESRVMNLLEGFLTDVLTKEENDTPFLFGNTEDIKNIQVAEVYISANIDKPFAGVDVISKMACMSRTKFINLFQKVYGMSSFDYYQKKRLNLAFDAIKKKRHNISIADIAENIGYSSVSHFTAAFKKEFGILPKEFVYQLKEEELRSLQS